MNYIFHSAYSEWEWLQAELPEPTSVKRVVITGRNGIKQRFHGYIARVAAVGVPVDGEGYQITEGEECGRMSDYPSTSAYKELRNHVFNCAPGPLTGKFVSLQGMNPSQVMQIGEMVIMNTEPEHHSQDHGNWFCSRYILKYIYLVALMCLDLGTYNDPTVATVIAAGAWDCQDQCRAHAACQHFTYSTATSECFFKAVYIAAPTGSILDWSGTVVGDGCLYDS